MSLSSPLSAGDKVLCAVSAAIGNTIYLGVPGPGRIKLFQVVAGAATGTADETFTLAYAPPASATYTNVTGGTALLATASSAAGDLVSAAIAPSTSAYVQDGGKLRITPSGGGSGAAPLSFNIVVGP